MMRQQRLVAATEERKKQKINQLHKSYRHSNLVKNVIKLCPVLKKDHLEPKTALLKHEKKIEGVSNE